MRASGTELGGWTALWSPWTARLPPSCALAVRTAMAVTDDFVVTGDTGDSPQIVEAILKVLQ